MRVQVVLTPAGFAGHDLGGCAAVVVDVIRATTSVVAACAAGCRRVIPVSDPEAARACAARLPAGEALLAGEREGEPIPGFDLGNSPLEYASARVRGRTIVLTTTNGTAAMMLASRASVAAVAALTNIDAAARWARAQRRDVVVLCSGEKGDFCLEDAVAAGFLVEGMARDGTGLELSDAALAARLLAGHYAPALRSLIDDSAWARRLVSRGRLADVEACLAVGVETEVPVFQDGAIVPGARALTSLEAATHNMRGRRTGPEPTR
jgi:2-phosphosulfolactate phosphatase